MHSLCDECHNLELENWRHAFVPAEPVGRYCGANGECRDPLKRCGLGCRRAADELTDLRQEMEQSEPGSTELAPCAICGDRRKTNEFKAGLLLCEPCIYAEGQPCCSGCGSNEPPFGLVSHEGEDRFNELRCARCLLPSRRPPYAVAYQAGDGQLYGVALAGDAVATVEHGVLKVSHPSGVASIIQVRPMEGA